MSRHDVYRDGRVHVLREQCSTCIFRPGNLMQLKPGRVRGMIDDAIASGSGIVCHATLYERDVRNALCAGFVERHGDSVVALRLARIMGAMQLVDPPGR